MSIWLAVCIHVTFPPNAPAQVTPSFGMGRPGHLGYIATNKLPRYGYMVQSHPTGPMADFLQCK